MRQKPGSTSGAKPPPEGRTPSSILFLPDEAEDIASGVKGLRESFPRAPSGGKLGEVGSGFVANPQAVMEKDLHYFKEIMKGRATPEEIQQRSRKRNLRRCRGMATRYEKRGANYRAMMATAGLMVWLTT